MLKTIFQFRKLAAVFIFVIALASLSFASEANLIVLNLASVSFFENAVNGKMLLMFGFFICAFGLMSGLYHFLSIKNLPVYNSMKSISELIYETYKTYLVTQGKFIIVVACDYKIVYFGLLQHHRNSRQLHSSVVWNEN
ncbi:MAG: hypothetical protein LBS81_05530 [Endomicrobium sp.]|jgi:K(+)-stimulated pyrophosphate-energized sodium pump|nr:hypothetical protein [Endomicrobium sp.]